MEALRPEVEIERGFICRTFYLKGGKKISQMFVEAKSNGVNAEWFTDVKCKLVWMASEEIFKSPDFNKTNLLQICKKANQIAKNSDDPETNSYVVDRKFFDDCEKFVRGEDDYPTYCSLLKDNVLARKTKEAMFFISESIANGENTQQALSRLISNAQGILQCGMNTRRISVKELTAEMLRKFEEAKHQVQDLGNYEFTPGLPLPWRKLSYAMGGFEPGLYILAARPGVGKTSLSLNFSRYWIDMGKKVMFNTLDMASIGLVMRMVSERSRVSSRKMQFGKDEYFEDDFKKVKESADWLNQMEDEGYFSLYCDPDVDRIKAEVSILKDQGKIDVLIVDYLQLMTYAGCEKVGSTQKVTRISNVLHSITTELNVPVLCLSQLNRDTTKDGGREPQLSDLRESGAIEQDATAVMLLHREDSIYSKWQGDEPPVQYAKDPNNLNAISSFRPITMILAKARNGDEGTRLPYVVIQSKMAWYLGDYEQHEKADKFARVYDDWRHDPLEEVWAANGALIRMADVRAFEQAQMKFKARNTSSSYSQPIPPPMAPTPKEAPAHTPSYVPAPAQAQAPARAPVSQTSEEDDIMSVELGYDVGEQ